MITVVRCPNCNKSSMQPGDIIASIELSTFSTCDKCYNHKDYKHFVWFCSPACMVEWITTKPEEFKKHLARVEDVAKFYKQGTAGSISEES